jgi:hypothetical protein
VPTLGKGTKGEPSALLTSTFIRLIRFLLKLLGTETRLSLIEVDHQRNLWRVNTQASGLPMTVVLYRAPFVVFLLAALPMDHSPITR